MSCNHQELGVTREEEQDIKDILKELKQTPTESKAKQVKKPPVTREEVFKKSTQKYTGSWTKAQLAEWGVNYHTKRKGWISRLASNSLFPEEKLERPQVSIEKYLKKSAVA